MEGTDSVISGCQAHWEVNNWTQFEFSLKKIFRNRKLLTGFSVLEVRDTGCQKICDRINTTEISCIACFEDNTVSIQEIDNRYFRTSARYRARILPTKVICKPHHKASGRSLKVARSMTQARVCVVSSLRLRPCKGSEHVGASFCQNIFLSLRQTQNVTDAHAGCH